MKRLIVLDASDDIVAIAQVQVRKIGCFRLFYMQGCPLIMMKGRSRASEIIENLVSFQGLKVFDLLIISFENFSNVYGTAALLTSGFLPINSRRDYTLELNVTQNLSEVLKLADPGWRKSLKKAERNQEISSRFIENISDRLVAFDRFWSMHLELKERKRFESGLQGEHLRDLIAGDPHFRFLEIWEGDECVLVRIAHVTECRFTDFFVGSNERARKTGASALSIWLFAERAAAENRQIFDLGGVDPSGNRAVFEFKRGLCNNIVETGPRWLWGRSKILKSTATAYFVLS